MFIINRIGQRYGRLVVIRKGNSPSPEYIVWECQCDCGNIINIKAGNLNSGNTKSCGCLNREMKLIRSLKHGKTNTAEYRSWAAMKIRCLVPTDEAYKDYGGRGIKICERWLHSFENFFEDMGKRPTMSHTLDRFPNKNGNYEPSNCRWATKKEQAENRRSNKWYDYDGKKMIQKDWARYFNIDVRQFHKRIKRIGAYAAIDYYNNKIKK